MLFINNSIVDLLSMEGVSCYASISSNFIHSKSSLKFWLSLLLSSVLFIISTNSYAGDKPDKPLSWEGLYLGLNAGADNPLHTSHRLQAGSGYGSAVYDLYPYGGSHKGGTFGAQIGHNWQKDALVWGVEADFNILNGRSYPNGAFGALNPDDGTPLFYTIQQHTNANYFASMRGKLGFALDKFLLYGTGGFAEGGGAGPATLTLYSNNTLDVFNTARSQSSRMKYAFGGGVEYAFSEKWRAKAEYLFLSQSLNTHTFDDGNGYEFISRIRNETNIFRFGINHYFGEENELNDESNPYYGNGVKDDDAPEMYSFHGLSTSVAQAYPKFYAEYNGPKSLPSQGQGDVLTQNDLYFGIRLWKGAAFYVNPETNLGYGLANSAGSAAYVNGLAQKIGRDGPYMRFQRYMVKQIIGLNGDQDDAVEETEGARSELLESLQNQVSGKVDKNRITLTVGKFAVGDIFDDNLYAHDPTVGFLNFAFNSMGAFDYAADAWGYSNGASVEWKQNWWTLRAGGFQLSTVPNGYDIDPKIGHQYMAVTEFETRYNLFGQPGEVKLLAFGDNGNFAKFKDVINLAISQGNLPPDVTALQQRHFKPGMGVNFEQQIMPGFGIFARASMSDGRYQTVDYTDVDRQITGGVVAEGQFWGRDKDTIGFALAASGISGDHQKYFALGGLGTYIGDGALSYASEHVLETFYKIGINKYTHLTFDYQLLDNPGYNSSRGPANVFGLRLRAEF